MPKSRKRRLYVYVDEDVYRKLIVLAPMLTGRIERALSQVVEMALKEFIEKVEREHKQGGGVR